MGKYEIKDSYGWMMATATQQLRHELSRRFLKSGFDISTEQWKVMVLIRENSGITQKDLALYLNRSKVAVSKVVSGLEKKGLIRKSENPEDARSFKLFLTKKGDEIIPSLNKIATMNREDAVIGITEEEIKIFKKVLKTIIKNTGN